MRHKIIQNSSNKQEDLEPDNKIKASKFTVSKCKSSSTNVPIKTKKVISHERFLNKKAINKNTETKDNAKTAVRSIAVDITPTNEIHIENLPYSPIGNNTPINDYKKIEFTNQIHNPKVKNIKVFFL